MRMFFSIRYFFFMLFAVNSFFSLHAQVIDSIQSAFKKKPKLIGGFDTKTSFIDGFNSPIFSLQAGLDFNHLVLVGGGLSFLKLSSYSRARSNPPFYIDKIIVSTAGKKDTLHSALQFVYFNCYAEYIFYRSQFWQFSVPIQLGIGDSRYKYYYHEKKYKENKHLILLYEPAVSGQYKIRKWLGVGLDVGYRFMLINNKKIGSKFNSPVYEFGVLVFWGPIFKAVFPTTKWAEQIEE